MSTNQDASSADEPVGQTLARLRRAKGITGAQLAARTGMSQPKISRIERGRGGDPADILLIGRELGLPDEEIRLLVERAGVPRDRMTDWRPVSPNLSDMQREIGEWESATSTLRIFESTIIHGLLQTSGYATSILTETQRLAGLEGGAISEAAALEAVSGRIRRQEVLADQSKTFRFVMAEAALAMRVCPPAEMMVQIDKIRQVATRENVSVKIVPEDTTWGIPPQHGFVILDDRLVSVDLYNTGLTSRGKLDLVRYSNVFDTFDALATEDIEPILTKYDNLYLGLLRDR
jgi:transcriptional regulator with XRE-family HTH domain